MISRKIFRQAQSLPKLQSSSYSTALRSLNIRQPLPSRFPAPVRARIAARWYSQEQTQAEKSGDASANASADGASQPSAEDAHKKALEAKDREIIDLKDKYLRQVAEFRNLQERTKKEVQAARDFGIQRFAKDLVESVDTFDLALSQVPAERLAAPADAAQDPHKELRQLHSGLKMTETVLLNTLKKHGLERFDPSEKNEKFDPNLHEATFQTPQPDKEDGTCFFTTQKGFVLNGRVLRAAKVGVVKNS